MRPPVELMRPENLLVLVFRSRIQQLILHISGRDIRPPPELQLVFILIHDQILPHSSTLVSRQRIPRQINCLVVFDFRILHDRVHLSDPPLSVIICGSGGFRLIPVYEAVVGGGVGVVFEEHEFSVEADVVALGGGG